jgi:hypothetical protein
MIGWMQKVQPCIISTCSGEQPGGLVSQKQNRQVLQGFTVQA